MGRLLAHSGTSNLISLTPTYNNTLLLVLCSIIAVATLGTFIAYVLNKNRQHSTLAFIAVSLGALILIYYQAVIDYPRQVISHNATQVEKALETNHGSLKLLGGKTIKNNSDFTHKILEVTHEGKKFQVRLVNLGVDPTAHTYMVQARGYDSTNAYDWDAPDDVYEGENVE